MLANRSISDALSGKGGAPHELELWAAEMICEQREIDAQILELCGHREAADLLRSFNLRDTEDLARKAA